MKEFARLFAELAATTKTNAKVEAMVSYLSGAAPEDAAWAVRFLSGYRPKRLIPVRRLAAWAMQAGDIPEWLFEECYHAVGDLAETITLLLPAPTSRSDRPLHDWIEDALLPLAGEDEETQRAVVLEAWASLAETERFVWNKLITGSFRVGVSQSLVVRAIARTGGVDEAAVAHRLMGSWEPTAEGFLRLLSAETADADLSRPYPFFLAYALEGEVDALGEAEGWQVEWTWDGIRAQVIRRGGSSWIWSRGEELINERFPELADAAALLPDGTVLDVEILPWMGDAPLPFAQLQRRIGRKKLGPRILSEVPVVLVVYDLLEAGGEDLRERPLAERRARLERLLTSGRFAGRLRLSPIVAAEGWDQVREAFEGARGKSAEGLMLKRKDAAYGVGRRKGAWWKWKVAPFTVDAVMI